MNLFWMEFIQQYLFTKKLWTMSDFSEAKFTLIFLVRLICQINIGGKLNKSVKLAKSFFLLIILVSYIILVLPSYSNQGATGIENTSEDGMWISGQIIWKGHDLSKAMVEVYKDPDFTEPYTGGIVLKKEGTYSLTIKDAGTYYIMVFVDDNDNKKLDTGDGVGIYGISNRENPNQKPEPIVVEEGAKLSGVDIEITGSVSESGTIKSFSNIPDVDISTGIRGKVLWPGNKLENTILFVYSDPSWSNRIAQTEVSENGEYAISVPPGRYYLLAVIDENNSNLLDVGDKFGIWGMTRFGVFPKAVEVKNGQITENRNILIIGQTGFGGKALPLTNTENLEDVSSAEGTIIVTGNVLWPGKDVKNGMVQVYGDPSMTVKVTQAKTDDKGNFRFLVSPGAYYIMAGIDRDADGKYTQGDGFGAYGVSNAAEEMPEKLVISSKSESKAISIVITAEFDSSGQLIHIPYNPEQQKIDDKLSLDSTPDDTATGISGKITWEGQQVNRVELILSDNSIFEDGTKIPLELSEEGDYVCSVPPGEYYIMAFADIDEDQEINYRDGRGFYGAGFTGEPQKVTVLEGRLTPLINIAITESLDRNGKFIPIQTPESVRFWYGKPDDIYSPEADTQRWRYWKQGIMFTFEKNDFGWNLTEVYEFDPVEDAEKPEEGEPKDVNNQNGKIFFTFDTNIWKLNDDASSEPERLGPGSQPSTTSDGKKLLFLDTTSNLYMAEMEGNLSVERILKRRDAGLQPSISGDGKAIAYVKSYDGKRRILLRNIKTEEEDELPVDLPYMYSPNWSPDGELISYAGASIYSQEKLNRDIYYYDMMANRVERVTSDDADETEPAWSPLINQRMLVYSKAEGNHYQLWFVTFDENGIPDERQLTRYGGRNPSWSPDGNKIVYENNAQLWTIRPDGTEEEPILVNDEPVFGFDPSWTK
ncbi:hypothetical protein GF312_02920 [Candidatus Poribacteria bacterium]|nr:hypothetical protein [Candidatus Poribacteria bacterium]